MPSAAALYNSTRSFEWLLLLVTPVDLSRASQFTCYTAQVPALENSSDLAR